MTTWLKTFRPGNTLSPLHDPDDLPPIGTEQAFLEPVSLDEHGQPKLTKQGERYGKPGWRPGELIAGYWAGRRMVNMVWEVRGTPTELPDDDDWSWETDVRLVAKGAPVSIDELAIEGTSLMRAVRLRLTGEQERLLLGAFPR